MSRRWAGSAFFLFFVASSCLASSLAPEMAAVEKIRGRKFINDVKTATIERATLGARLEKQVAQDLPFSIDDWGRVIRALQLVDTEGPQVLPKLLALYEAQVLAFYDPETHTYYAIDKLPPQVAEQSKGIDPKMLEEMVQVHELMHAMQDQHWNIGAKDKLLRADNDAMLAYHGLLEGEAVLVMLANLLSSTGVDLDAVMKNDTMIDTLMTAAQAEVAAPDSPKYFTEMLKFPYLDGLKFVVAAYRRGGWKELDRIHANPPRSTREILHPEDYFAGKFKADVFDETKPEGALSVEHMGEFHWAFLAGAENARGWVGDRAVVMKNGRVDVETKWETPEAAAKFAGGYGAFLKTRNVGAKVTREGAVVRATYQTK
ncbi:MAG: hypothetical protein QOH21_906 [Acidobacteriota bacterium]|nr:hypothetical protein [Acidobacteriota bacterium]